MSLRPRTGLGRVSGAFSAAKAKIKKRKKEVIKLKTGLLESQLAQVLTKAQKTAKAAGSGLTKSSGAVLKILQERGHAQEKRASPSGDGGTGPDIPTPKGAVGKTHEAQHLTVHLSKKPEPDTQSGGRESRASELARHQFCLHFQSAELKELGLTFEEVRFRNRLIVMWYEYQQKLRPLSYADQLVFDILLRLMIEYYGLYTSAPTEEPS